ncbi:Similar to Aminopeptidase N; acc. no. O57579 [Pyronema omphalodes CBS 100304]|uniref:Similar to Aminopeptidase N acc. no. O57579 n=1 Tax=Pyronema omphalodes (strain CBS 100304) TaxID=1076935 RepID=U4LEI9_PYROM|nr:Similar to Aminopeptidase N; acc. no. O57579 [Pyronema omphalodes CBS 100304]
MEGWNWRMGIRRAMVYCVCVGAGGETIWSLFWNRFNRINFHAEHTSSTRTTDICGIMVLQQYAQLEIAVTFIVKELQVHPNELYRRLQNISLTVDP